MDLRQQADPRPPLQVTTQGRAADLASRRAQAAPGRALAQELPQGRNPSDDLGRRVAASTLATWRADLNDRGDQVQDPEIQSLLPCLKTSDMGSISRSGALTSDRNHEC